MALNAEGAHHLLFARGCCGFVHLGYAAIVRGWRERVCLRRRRPLRQWYLQQLCGGRRADELV